MFQVYLRKGVSRRGTGSNNNITSDPQITFEFVPHVLKSSRSRVSEIPSMSVLDRIKFLGENVSNVFSSKAVFILLLQEVLI